MYAWLIGKQYPWLLLGALGPFKTVLRFHITDIDLLIILGVFFLAIVNP